jgi:hypothetical protein
VVVLLVGVEEVAVEEVLSVEVEEVAVEEAPSVEEVVVEVRRFIFHCNQRATLISFCPSSIILQFILSMTN